MATTKASTKVLLVTGGAGREGRRPGRSLEEILEDAGRFNVSAVTLTSNGAPVLTRLRENQFGAVVLRVAGTEALPADQIEALAAFVEAGGGAVIVSPSGQTLVGSDAGRRLMGVALDEGSPVPFEMELRWTAQARDAGIPMAIRVDDFTLTDTLQRLELLEETVPFAVVHVNGDDAPIGVCRPLGKGRSAFLGMGGTEAALRNPHVRRLIVRSVRYAQGERFEGEVRAGIVGYGGAFNMGLQHAEAINAQAGMKTVAVCDLDKARTEQAKKELGDHLRTYQKMEGLIEDDGVDLLVGILPHNLHAEMCISASRAGKHVVTEKPFCLTLEEADRMIAAARDAERMLSCFHNRRWDGDFRQMLTVVQDGEIGDVFHIDAGTGHWRAPRAWWRSSKAVSGGVLYDWGAHYVDWLLNLMPRRIESVSGLLQKRFWHNTTNEDFALVTVRFEDGSSATLEQGTLVAAPRKGMRVLGSLGAVANDGPGAEVQVTRCEGGITRRTSLSSWQPKWSNYYQNVANHLLMGEGLVVTAQQARRVIGVLDLAERSNRQGGRPLELPGEDAFKPDFLPPL